MLKDLGRADSSSVRSQSAFMRHVAEEPEGIESTVIESIITRWMSCPCGGVVQLVRTSACHAGSRGFESRRARQFFRSRYNYKRVLLPGASEETLYSCLVNCAVFFEPQKWGRVSFISVSTCGKESHNSLRNRMCKIPSTETKVTLLTGATPIR
jgi:hypothetical protein